jgi:lipid-A-disaccharide synthase
MSSPILIIAGEKSGEKYGANLVRQFKRTHPSSVFFGIGGKEMESAGVELIHTIEELAVVGIFELIAHLPRIKRVFNHILKTVKTQAPAAAILIDSPDFNLRLAKVLKKLSIPVLYYISPTVWAWRKNRLKGIKKTVDKMMLIFPFEEKIYQEHRIPAVYVGHPLLESINLGMNRQEFCQSYRYDFQKKIVAVMPGSRKSEIKFHMPVLMRACGLIQQSYDVQFAVLLAESLRKEDIVRFIPPEFENIRIQETHHYETIASSDIALAACGTANLEAALLGTPVVSFYRVSALTYSFGIKFIRIQDYSIVNILTGERVIPELIQKDFTPDNILKEVKNILDSESVRSDMTEHFKQIKDLLGKNRASENAAAELSQLINASQVEDDSQSRG